MIKRIMTYLNEMHPPYMFLVNFLYAITFFLMLFKLNQSDFEFHLFYIFAGIAFVFMVLLIRIMDEFKDYQDDLTNFPQRPLPSGRVTFKDLKALGIFSVCAIVFFNLFNFSMFMMSALCLIYSFLMLKWFFIETKMRKSLPLAFVSHHPIVFLYLIYFGQTFYEISQLAFWQYSWIMLPVALGATNWEIARKLRTPDEESQYTTYSKIWGVTRASIVSLMIQIIILIGINFYFAEISSPLFLIIIYNILFVTLGIIPTTYYLIKKKFLFNLRNCAESLLILNQITLLLSYFL